MSDEVKFIFGLVCAVLLLVVGIAAVTYATNWQDWEVSRRLGEQCINDGGVWINNNGLTGCFSFEVPR